MKRFHAIVLLVAVASLVSCARRVEGGFDTIKLVNRLVTDSLPSLHRLAREAGKASGPVALVGDPRACLELGESMMNADGFDNVDGRRVKDGLPDFAGETIVSLLDFASYPYDSLALTDDGRMELREIAVRNALAAIDTSVRCKVLVICSPVLASHGGDDVADLFGRIGCSVPVIYSSDPAFPFSEACFKVMRDRNIFTHKIAYPSARLLVTVPDPLNPPFSITGFDDSLVPESFTDTVGILAPNTYISYVQNKH